MHQLYHLPVSLLAAESILPEIPKLVSPWVALPNELMQGLLFLLPGLVTVAIINSLTVRQKLEPLERVIQALLYTFVNHVTWQIVLLLTNFVFLVFTWGHFRWEPTAKGQLIGLGLLAIGWGLIVTWFVNLGWLHDKLRDLKWLRAGLEKLRLARFARALPAAMWFGITKRSSRPSEWYDAFYDADNQFVVVHLKDRRRIYGWVNLYPDLPTEGHLLICDAEWLDDEPAKPDSPKRPLVRILLNVADVQFVEFIATQTQEDPNGDNATETLPARDQGNGEAGRRECEAGRPKTPSAAPAPCT